MFSLEDPSPWNHGHDVHLFASRRPRHTIKRWSVESRNMRKNTFAMGWALTPSSATTCTSSDSFGLWHRAAPASNRSAAGQANEECRKKVRACTYFALVAAHGVFYNTCDFLEVIRGEVYSLLRARGTGAAPGTLGFRPGFFLISAAQARLEANMRGQSLLVPSAEMLIGTSALRAARAKLANNALGCLGFSAGN